MNTRLFFLTVPILSLCAWGSLSLAQESPPANPLLALSSCVNDAVTTNPSMTAAAVKAACEQPYAAVQSSLGDNVRASTMASIDQMIADRVAAANTAP